jgi:hypothetical protein
MKEFDKIYIAKYYEKIPTEIMGKSFNVSSRKINNIIEELKKDRVDEVYKLMSDEEWEKTENQKDDYVRKKYILKQKEKDKAIFKQILDVFTVSVEQVLNQFEIFDELKWELKATKDRKIIDEEWKQIEDFNYSISNYGRLRNDKNGKIMSIRYTNWRLQGDIYKDGKKYTINIPRVEASLFIRKVLPEERITYYDGDKRNNYYKNLKIVSK